MNRIVRPRPSVGRRLWRRPKSAHARNADAPGGASPADANEEASTDEGDAYADTMAEDERSRTPTAIGTTTSAPEQLGLLQQRLEVRKIWKSVTGSLRLEALSG